MARHSGEAADGQEDRLDRLEARVAELAQSVEAGLVAQARRVESVVGTTRRELVEVMRDHSDVVEATSRAVREAMEDRPLDSPEGTEGDLDVRDVLQQDRLTFREAVRRETEQFEQRLRADLQGVVDDVRGMLVDPADRAGGQDQRAGEAVSRVLDESVATVTEQLRSVVDDLTARLVATEARMQEAVSALREADESLQAHLVDRDRQAALERSHLTQAFVEQLAGALSRRDRRRLARKLVVAEAPEAGPAPGGDPTGPRDAPTVEDPREPTGEPAVDHPAPDVPPEPDGDPVPAPDPQRAAATRRRVRPSLGARPVHDRASVPQDPAAMRRTLAAVRGLGPARQAALVEAFGSLEELREATDDELLAVRGIGPALLEPIRAAVG